MLSNSRPAGGITDSNSNNRRSAWKLRLYNVPAGTARSGVFSRFSADPLLKIDQRGLVITPRCSSITTTAAAGPGAGSEPELLLGEEPSGPPHLGPDVVIVCKRLLFSGERTKEEEVDVSRFI